VWFENQFSFTSIPEPGDQAPSQFELSQNYPNPFNPTTQIKFRLTKTGNVTLSVFNILGQKVATLLNGKFNAGSHQVIFDGQRLASGVYTYQLKAGDRVQTRKMLLVK
jgi:hypothetical protein